MKLLIGLKGVLLSLVAPAWASECTYCEVFHDCFVSFKCIERYGACDRSDHTVLLSAICHLNFTMANSPVSCDQEGYPPPYWG